MTDSLSGVAPPRAEFQLPAQVSQIPLPAAPAQSQAVAKAVSDPGVESRPAAADSRTPASSVAELVSTKELAATLHKINLTFDLFEIAAEFSMAKEGHRVQVTLRNTHTGEVIRQIPPDEFLDNFSSFKNGVGMLFNKLF
jgi:uncharacterized FlaG/YvyC family protein